MTKYYTANVDPSRLIVVTNHAGTVAPGKCRVRQATKEELDELDKLLGPVDKASSRRTAARKESTRSRSRISACRAIRHGRKRRPKSGQRKKPPSGRP